MHRQENELTPETLSDFTCYCISNSPERFQVVIENLMSPFEDRRNEKPYCNVEYFDGTDASCFSALVNTAICSAKTEIIIIVSDRARFDYRDLIEAVRLLELGYGFVSFGKLAFFGFKKELIRRIGFFEEGFYNQKGFGGSEDDDFYIRLVENKISHWISNRVIYDKSRKSLWQHYRLEESKKIFSDKWNDFYILHKNSRFKRMRSDSYNPEYVVSIGESDSSIEFLPYKMSVCLDRIILDIIENAENSWSYIGYK